MLKYKDNLFGPNSLAYSLGKRSIEFFSMFFLQDTFVPKPDNQARNLSPTHYEVWNLLEECLIEDKFDKLVLCLPRGFAKSTIVTFATVIHQAVYATAIGFYQIVIGKTEADAQQFIFDVRKQFEENPYIKYTFGELINSRQFTVNKNELHLSNNCKVHALSSTSSIRGKKHLGKRPSSIYLDDTQGLDDVLTDQAKQKKMETFQKDILFSGDEPVWRNGKKIKSGTKFLICGTVLAHDCFISKLIKDKTYKSIVKRAVLVDDIDALFASEYWSVFRDLYYDNKNQYAEIDAKNYYYDNEDKMRFPTLWEDKWHPIDLALKYYSDPIGFKQEMMNDSTILTGGKCFFTIKTIPRIEMEEIEFTRTMMTVDCAVETGARNDYTSICIGSKGMNGHRYIRKGILMKVDFDTYVSKVIELLKEFPELTHIIIEKNTYQGVDAKEIKKKIDEDQQLSKRIITIINDRQMKNKENRIRATSGKINNGFIIFCQEDEEFWNQILQYQGSNIGHDDAADTVSELDVRIDEINVIQSLKFFDKSLLF